ncbi:MULTISPECIES: hypothetical protein [Streptomyces]|uniref:hypothetical protein n=1 Tax=Streptomyces TaxID=1883 RepID=UPI001E6238FD|nr:MULTISPECIES: hypothetical protein [Streptomyces]UFQ16447.1 hypothetical protein J2N69_16340 [Streptomyces huasconensis]WCL86049.1 hypothetical protein PPN52_16350 [Streptomyces sp. JCM 35825]
MDIYADGAAGANQARAQWAMTALKAFGQETGQKGEEYFSDTLTMEEWALREVAGDLLANLFHLARLNGMDPRIILAAGAMHFTEEVEEEWAELEQGAIDAAADELTADFRSRGLPQLEAFLKGEGE